MNLIQAQQDAFNGVNAIAAKTKTALKYAAPVAVICLPSLASAVTAPTTGTGTIGYDIYQTADKLLNGPVGFVGGLIMIVLAASQVTKNWMMAATGLMGGTAVLKAKSITESLGMTL